MVIDHIGIVVQRIEEGIKTVDNPLRLFANDGTGRKYSAKSLSGLSSQKKTCAWLSS
jgi:hypothetical protein